MLPLVHDISSPGPSLIIIRRALPGLSLIALFATGLPGPAAAQRVYRDYEDGTRHELTDEDMRRLSIEQNRHRAGQEDIYDGREGADSPRGPGGSRRDDDDDDDDLDRDDNDDYDGDDDRDDDAGFEDDEIFEPRDRDDRANWNEGRLTDPAPQPDANRATPEEATSGRPPNADGNAAQDTKPLATTPLATPPPSAPPAGRSPPSGWKPAMGKAER